MIHIKQGQFESIRAYKISPTRRVSEAEEPEGSGIGGNFPDLGINGVLGQTQDLAGKQDGLGFVIVQRRHILAQLVGQIYQVGSEAIRSARYRVDPPGP